MSLDILIDGWPFRQMDELAAHAGGVAAAEPGVYSVLLNGRVYEVRLTAAGGAWQADVRGSSFVVEIRDPRNSPRSTGAHHKEGPQQVIAAMPGKVVRLLVAEGDRVEAGQGLIVVEAMKMQNEMKSPKAGRVAQLLAREGSTVAAGEALVTIE